MAGDDGRTKFMDDLAGMAGGAFSVLAGIRTEAEQMAKSQAEAMVRRLDLVKREELDAAMEVARRAREQAETLEERVAALEARLDALALEARLDAPAPEARVATPEAGGESSPES